MHSSAIEMRSPAVSSMSISRPPGWSATSWARRTRSSVVLPIAETTTTTSSPARRVRDDVIGDGPDAIGVGDRGAAELLNEETHGRQGYRRPAVTPRTDFAALYIQRPCRSADKRQRKKENAPGRARGVRGRGQAAQAAIRHDPQRRDRRRGLRGRIAASSTLGGDDKKDASTDDRRAAATTQPPTSRRRQDAADADDDRPDQDVHRDDLDDLRRHRRRARREERADRRDNFVFLAAGRLLRRAHVRTASSRTS